MKVINECPFKIDIVKSYKVSRWGKDFQVEETDIPSRFNNDSISIFIRYGNGCINGNYLPYQLEYNKTFSSFEEIDKYNKEYVPICIPVESLYDAVKNEYIMVCHFSIIRRYIKILKNWHNVYINNSGEIKERHYIINSKTIKKNGN